MRLGILLFFFLGAVFLGGAACQRQSNPNAAIESAIQEHLSRRPDLATGRMVMEMEQVRVNGDRAEAEVIFRATTAPPAQIAYHYELRREAGQWRVEGGRPSGADSTHPAPEHSSESSVPEGHPPLDDLPPHP